MHALLRPPGEQVPGQRLPPPPLLILPQAILAGADELSIVRSCFGQNWVKCLGVDQASRSVPECSQ
jgi:hypothetical protein